MDFQYYPTPKNVAIRAWSKFKNKNFVRVLEPSAGTGELAEAAPFRDLYHRRGTTMDCCEIDVTHHPVLREKGLNVVGHDFLAFGCGSMYSHIVMNPPFAAGATHVLKAWDVLWDGEIVAIINAETLRNPFSKERRHLVSIIEIHGTVEYISDAFRGSDVAREAQVDIALVYLRKEADLQRDVIGDLVAQLKGDTRCGDDLANEFSNDQLPAIPNSTIENAVLVFNAAVRSSQLATFALAKSRYYSALMGRTMAEHLSADCSPTDRSASTQWVQTSLAEQYADLKDRAWAGILRSTNVTSKLSSQAQKRLEKEFEQIKLLEFTVRNVYGFLCGLVEKQSEIQLDMACDVFDAITRYHSDNTVFYKGWKSNDSHRTCGRRIKTTRFILPNNSMSFGNSLRYESERQLQDFDKVFAMLDGKQAPDFGLYDAFDKQMNALRSGARVSTSYFDVRYYPGAGTIHFFARDKKIVDRLNRLVGRYRKWLPAETTEAPDVFWKQFEQAEKLDKEFRAEVTKRTPRYAFGWDGAFGALSSTGESRDQAEALLLAAADEVLQRHGIDPDLAIQSKPTQQLRLAA
jgi:hypothetical protein